MTEDYALIEDFLSGNKRAFEELVKKYQNRVVNTVYSIIGSADGAEDIAQEVFIQVHHSLGSFKKEAQFTSWLYRITVNKAYDFLRRRRPHVDITEVENLLAQRSEDKESKELIQQALEKLPLKLRTVVVLKEIEGFSYKEIAEIVKCRIGTVESRLFRAREALKKIVDMLSQEIKR